MSNYCRLCAEFKDSSEIITSISDQEKCIEEKLIACCEWNAEDTENLLPQSICELCFEKLEQCWLFSQSVQQAQHKLQEVFENVVEVKPVVSKSKLTFECYECSKTFLSRLALEKHQELENECGSIPQDIKCELCRKRFKTSQSLRAHCKKQSDHRCEVCLEMFCKEKRLKEHKEQGCGEIIENIFKRESKPTFVDCSSELETIGEEQERNEDAQIGFNAPPLQIENEQVECSKSEIQIVEQNNGVAPTTFDDIELQIRMNENENTNEKNAIENQHVERDDGNAPQYYVCYLCDRGFKKYPLLRCHMVVHTNPRRFKCQYCNSRFRTERHYTSHQKNHVDYFCDECNKKFPSAFALKVHRRMHVGSSAKMYGCEECDHFFVDVSTFYNHMRRRHGLDTAAAKKKAKLIQPNGSAKPYVCELCGKDFRERSSLKAHSVVHLDIRPFQCEVCSKSFKNKYNLKTHQETHTGEKSVQCTECGKTYSRKSVLVKHMEEHTGVFTKIFPCDFCDRTFRSLYNMHNHRRTHTGEKPFRCDVCNHDLTSLEGKFSFFLFSPTPLTAD